MLLVPQRFGELPVDAGTGDRRRAWPGASLLLGGAALLSIHRLSSTGIIMGSDTMVTAFVATVSVSGFGGLGGFGMPV
jgi:hypothetical protein